MAKAIIIPAADVVKEAENLLTGLLYSIHKGGISSEFDVHVCFDGCQERFVEGISERFSWIFPLVNSGNRRNFTGNANMGLRHIRDEGIYDGVWMVNQDCILPNVKYWLNFQGSGVVSATQVTLPKEDMKVTDEDIQELDLMQPQTFSLTSHRKVTGFCQYLSKALIDKIGVFDEYFRAGFDDDDYCARAVLAGFPVEQSSILVHHYVSKCGAYTQLDLNVGLMKFRTKWGLPKELKHEDFAEYITTKKEWLPEMKEL